jgi:hypothetical protein
MTDRRNPPPYELVFVGGTRRRYRRYHSTYDSARETAGRVLEEMSMSGDPRDEQRAAHSAIIYGPDCGRDGTTVF